MSSGVDAIQPVRLLPLSEEAAVTVGDRLASLHRQVTTVAPQIDQIACVLYDADTGTLKTYVDSSHAGAPLRRYEFPLAGSRSLSELVRTRRARVVDDMPTQLPGNAPHTVHIRSAGFRSSYTVPLFDGEAFQGFLFMDSRQPAVFSADVLGRIDVYVNLVRMLLCHELTAARALVGSIRVAHDFAVVHDASMARHLERMARYSRMIARRVAVRHDLTDEFVEQVFLFAPLHDIGKVGIPDPILHKTEWLTPAERAVMATHVELGVQLVEKLITHFRLERLAGIEVLRNIVAGHHEFLDGSGYPRGLGGDAIPLEARIVTVADIFDALSSRREYKAAWSIDDALAALARMADAGKIDPDCVSALVESRGDIGDVRRRYGGGDDDRRPDGDRPAGLARRI